mmetsp:Transcript_4546/g.11092  ORF Transcript_4546/g.11092 Transcript_4546/m.11092 type:complete len:360 (+) Transcript_4546:2857-3936(+)
MLLHVVGHIHDLAVDHDLHFIRIGRGGGCRNGSSRCFADQEDVVLLAAFSHITHSHVLFVVQQQRLRGLVCRHVVVVRHAAGDVVSVFHDRRAVLSRELNRVQHARRRRPHHARYAVPLRDGGGLGRCILFLQLDRLGSVDLPDGQHCDPALPLRSANRRRDSGRTEELNALDSVDVLAGARHIEQHFCDPARVVPVQIAQQRLHALRRLRRVVVRDFEVQVVHHVRRADTVVHVVEEPRVGTVDRAQSAAQPVEGVDAQMRHVRVRVLEPGVQHQPPVRDQIRQKVVHRHRVPAVRSVLGPVGENERHGDDSNAGQVHAEVPLRRKDLAVRRVEVGDVLFLVQLLAPPVGAAAGEVRE